MFHLLFGDHPPRWIWGGLAILTLGGALFFLVAGAYGWAAVYLAGSIASATQAIPSRSERIARRRHLRPGSPGLAQASPPLG